MHTRTSRHSKFFPRHRFLPHKTLPRMLMLLWSVFFSLVGGYYILARLRVFASAPLPPSHVIAVNDDLFSTIKWTSSPDTDTVGYKVTWKDAGGITKTLFTPYSEAQLVSLAPGRSYRVFVQSVNKNGDLSSSVGPVIAQSDSSYVNSLKQQMTGMFDDFNDNVYNGLPNPLHWYTTVSNASENSMAYVSGDQNQLQMFVQNNSTSDNKNRAAVTMRSLAPFDFTNRTGTLAFDFDYGQPTGMNGADVESFQWSLTISPTRVDDIVPDAVYANAQVIYPLEAFQLHMENNTISFRKISNGRIVNEWDSTYSHTHPLRDIGILKHSLLKINTDSAQLFVDGIQILSASNINLGFSKGWVYNQQLAFSLSKDHIPFALSRFDNIGFDSPPGTSSAIIHTYTAGGYGVSDRKTVDFFNNTASYTITIPDSLSQEEAERLIVDANVHGIVAPTITVNQTVVAWPQLPGFDDNNNFTSRVISLPVGTLHTGVNTVVISATDKNTFNLAMQNVHVEVEFPQGYTGSYVPYQVPFSGNVVEEKIPSVAPLPIFGTNAPIDGQLVRGEISVEAVADGGYSLLPAGHVNPVTELELDVDGVPQTIYALSQPTTKADQVLQLDTTKIPNGQHTITITSYGEDKDTGEKTTSLNSFDPLLQNMPLTNGTQLRRVVIFSNGGPQPSPLPTVSIPQNRISPHSVVPSPTSIITPTATPSVSEEMWGNTVIGKIHDVADGNHINGIKFVTRVGGSAEQAHVYVGEVGSVPQNAYQMAIYSDDNNKPGSLIATTSQGVLIPFSWNSIPIHAQLAPNTAYWLVYNTNASADGTNNLVYENGLPESGVSVAYPYGNFPQTLPQFSLGAWEFSMYVSP